MRVGRIGHAGIVVSSGQTRVVMDPIFYNEFDQGTHRIDPPIRVNLRQLEKIRFDALIISHEHSDHFSPPSIDRINRDAVVIYPKGAALLELCLRWLGFKNLRPLIHYQNLNVGDLELTSTPSLVGFPEMGMVFRNSLKKSVWNMVDCTVNASVIQGIRKRFGQVDLAFAIHQPLLESTFAESNLSMAFPLGDYGRFLENLMKLDPKYVVPSSCGFKVLVQPWLNERDFPMTEEQFIRDILQMRPRWRASILHPGDEIDIEDDFRLKHRGLSFVRPLGNFQKFKHPRYNWRPDRGMPPLRDLNSSSYSERQLQVEIWKYFEGPFLKGLAEPRFLSWIKELKRLQVFWRLEIVFPSGEQQSKCLDFTRAQPKWCPDKPTLYPKLHTSAAASAILDLLRGEASPSMVVWGGMIRKFHRVYGTNKNGIETPRVKIPDPLSAVLFPSVWEKHLIQQLKNLGY